MGKPSTVREQVGGTHYLELDPEPWQVQEGWLRLWGGWHGYLLGNVLKYLARAPLKGDKLNDLRKAQHYLERLIEDVVHGPNEPAEDRFP